MILVIGGPPGSGKTTVAERWAAARAYVLVSADTKFRAMAKERGMSLEAFGGAAEKDPTVDRALDAAILAEIRKHDAAGANVVVDGRIQAHLLSKERVPCIKVLIDAPLDLRAERISRREKKSVEEARREIVAREESERGRQPATLRLAAFGNPQFELLIPFPNPAPEPSVAIVGVRGGG